MNTTNPSMSPRFSTEALRKEIDSLRIRRSRAHHTHGLASTLNLPAMIDLTFLFLIFFLVTTTFERAEGILASDMPKSKSFSSAALPVTPIVVRLISDRECPEGYSIRVDRLDVRPATFGELTDFLQSLQEVPGFDRETPVVIVADENISWDHVVGCWNAALRAQCKSIAFAEP